MPWWNVVFDKINIGDELFTPGGGMSGHRKKPFKVLSKDNERIIILSGKSPIPLEKGCFDAAERAFFENSLLWLRVASVHGNEPFESSMDKLVREATGSPLARGNYICSMLEHCGLVRYGLRGNRKVIELIQR
jgi:hypothetical protein